MLSRILFGVALIAAQAAAYNSKFTKVNGDDGSVKRYFDLDAESKTSLQMADGTYVVP